MKSSRLPQTVPGASNFRGMYGTETYGVAMSTVDGIRRVLGAILSERPGGTRPKKVRGGEG
jgi:hypothetical protein